MRGEEAVMQNSAVCSGCHLARGFIKTSKRGLTSTARFPTLNHYKILGVKQSAPNHEIRTAYITLSKKMHPDLNPGEPGQHDAFIKIKEAYEVLHNPLLRKEYDRQLTNPGVKVYTSHTIHKRGNVKTNQDEPFGEHENPSYRYSEFDYSQYGEEKEDKSKWFKRSSNSKVLKLIAVFVFMGTALQLSMCLGSRRYVKNQLDAKDRRIAAMSKEFKSPARLEQKRKEIETVLIKSNRGRQYVSSKLEASVD